MHCTVIRGDAWPVLLSPCNTTRGELLPLVCTAVVANPWVCCDGVWFGLVRSALFVADFLRRGDGCVASWVCMYAYRVLAGLFCLLRVTYVCTAYNYLHLHLHFTAVVTNTIAPVATSRRKPSLMH